MRVSVGNMRWCKPLAQEASLLLGGREVALDLAGVVFKGELGPANLLAYDDARGLCDAEKYRLVAGDKVAVHQVATVADGNGPVGGGRGADWDGVSLASLLKTVLQLHKGGENEGAGVVCRGAIVIAHSGRVARA